MTLEERIDLLERKKDGEIELLLGEVSNLKYQLLDAESDLARFKNRSSALEEILASFILQVKRVISETARRKV